MGSMNLWQPATTKEKGANSHLSYLGDIKSIREILILRNFRRPYGFILVSDTEKLVFQ